VLIWFTCLLLASMVYITGEPMGSLWYGVAAGLAVLIIFLSARAMARTKIITPRNEATMVIRTVPLTVLAPFMVIKPNVSDHQDEMKKRGFDRTSASSSADDGDDASDYGQGRPDDVTAAQDQGQ
jgi:hypothetical protein